MVDSVLQQNQRGHTAQDVQDASRQIQQFGLELGLQMMIGLFGSTMQAEWDTLHALLACRPDTMRFYPVVVLEETELAQRYRNGSYSLYSMEQVLDFCADAWVEAVQAGSRVIRCGLHDSQELRKRAVAGFYHPAFGELVKGRIYRRSVERYLQQQVVLPDTLQVLTASGTYSQVVGQKKCNVQYFAQQQVAVSVQESDALQPGQISIKEEVYDVFKGIGATRV